MATSRSQTPTLETTQNEASSADMNVLLAPTELTLQTQPADDESTIQLQIADTDEPEAGNGDETIHTPSTSSPAHLSVAGHGKEPETGTAASEHGAGSSENADERVAAMQQEGRSVALQLSEATHFLLTSLDYVSKRLQGVEKKVDDMRPASTRNEVEKKAKPVPDTAFCLPVLRNPDFLGREESLKAVLAMWKKGRKARIGVVGLGGIGKTEALLEFAYKLKHFSPLTPIFWFRPEDLLTKEGQTSTAAAGTQLDEWIKAEYSPDCVLFVDTGDRFQDLLPIIPRLHNFSGTIILITRSAYNARQVVGLHEVLEFPQLEASAVVHIFREKLDTLAKSNATEAQLYELCNLLHCNPRGMIQIVPTINRTGMKISQFLELYQKNDSSKLRLFGAVPPLVPAPPPDICIFGTGVIDILGFRAAFPEGPSKMLYQVYFLGGTAVPKSMFSGIDHLEMIITLHILTQYLLLTEDAQNQTLTLHPLVYLAMHKLITSQQLLESSPQLTEQRKWHEETILLFSKRYPDAKVESRAWWKDTFSHLITNYDLHSEALKTAAATIYNRETAFFKRRGMYQEALKMAVHARSVLPDPVPSSMYHILQSQAALLEKFARYSELSDLLSKFDVEEGTVGWVWKKRMLARTDMHNCVSGYESTLTIFKELNLPPLRQVKYDVSLASDDLASVLMAKGRYREAEVEAKRALTERSVSLGPGNASTLATCHHLAEILLLGGKLDQALSYISTAILGREKVLGHHHPDTEISRSLKGRVLVAKAATVHEFEEAETMINAAMEKLSTSLGAKHPAVWKCRSDIARIHFLRGNYNAAEDLYNTILTARSNGPWTKAATHPETLSTKHDIAYLLYTRDGPEAAASLSEEVLKQRKDILDATHPEVLDSLHLRALVLSGTGRHEEAIEAISSVYQQRQSTLGDSHPDTLLSMSYKGEILRLAPSESLPSSEIMNLTSQAFLQLTLIFGTEHQTTLQASTHLSQSTAFKSDCCASESFSRNWGSYKRALGAKHPETLKAQSRYAEALWQEGRQEEAKRMWREGCGGLVYTNGGPDGYDTVRFFKNFEAALEGDGEADGDGDDEDEWKDKEKVSVDEDAG